MLRRLQRHYSHKSRMAFSLVIELLEIIGFIVGFVAVVMLPAQNMQRDLLEIGDDWQTSFQAVKEELVILVDSSIQSRTLGFIAMVCIVTAFILRSIVSRIIHMTGDL